MDYLAGERIVGLSKLARTTTSALLGLLGLLRDDPRTRQELLTLVR